MPWQVTVDGVDVLLDRLTIRQVEHVETACRCRWDDAVSEPWRSADRFRVVATAATVLAGTGDPCHVRLSALTWVDDDLPDMWEDGAPTRGGRWVDGWVAALARPGPGMTPEQVRDGFTLRDLQLLGSAQEARE